MKIYFLILILLLFVIGFKLTTHRQHFTTVCPKNTSDSSFMPLELPIDCSNIYSNSVTTTIAPTTIEPATIAPTTIEPTTIEPTTIEPTTIEPTTIEPITIEPTTIADTQKMYDLETPYFEKDRLICRFIDLKPTNNTLLYPISNYGIIENLKIENEGIGYVVGERCTLKGKINDVSSIIITKVSEEDSDGIFGKIINFEIEDNRLDYEENEIVECISYYSGKNATMKVTGVTTELIKEQIEQCRKNKDIFVEKQGIDKCSNDYFKEFNYDDVLDSCKLFYEEKLKNDNIEKDGNIITDETWIKSSDNIYGFTKKEDCSFDNFIASSRKRMLNGICQINNDDPSSLTMKDCPNLCKKYNLVDNYINIKESVTLREPTKQIRIPYRDQKQTEVESKECNDLLESNLEFYKKIPLGGIEVTDDEVKEEICNTEIEIGENIYKLGRYQCPDMCIKYNDNKKNIEKIPKINE